jgi:hypothetical protein
MVLRSDLRIEAQESFDVGRVRVNVEQDGRLVGDADVKVVGSGDGRIQSGRTDLRGIFVADGVVGRATVLVRVGEGFAFHRGDAIHQPGRMPRPSPAQGRQQEQEVQSAGKEFRVWDNNLQLNDQNRRRQIQWLDREVLDRQQKGVEVFRAK